MKRNLLKLFLILLLIFFYSQNTFSQNQTNLQLIGQKIIFKNPNQIKISENLLQFNKLKPIRFQSFNYSDFKLDKSSIIRLKNGKSISAEKFLTEVNEIEKKLNDFGYSLHNQENEITLGRFKYPYEHLQKQASLLNESAKSFKADNLKISPCGLINEKEIQSALKSGKPKESWPIKKSKNWSVELGNNNFGVEINSQLNYSAEEKNSSLLVNSDTEVDIRLKILDEEIPALKLIDRIFNTPSQNNILLFLMNNKAIQDNLNSAESKNYGRELNWESGIEFSLGPFSVKGIIRTNGNAGLIKNFNPSNQKLMEELFPFIDLDFSGEINAGFEIAEAGIEGKLKIIDDTLKIKRNLELKSCESENFFDYSFDVSNNLSALKGKIYAYIKIDYLIGSKKFILIFYDNQNGVSLTQNILKENYIQPTKRDRELWLEINRISGITNYSARNEKLNIIPRSFIIEVEAAGQSFRDTIIDWNKDGIIEQPINFKIPMLSSLSIPIKISVTEIYKIGELNLDAYLDFVKGESASIQICYNPVSRKIYGDINGVEEQELISSGDKNFYGERNHSIKFKLKPNLKFNSAPAKVK
ncbi:Hypothetical protein IALB_1322 [Ignavibacterium album JCM 16511]|uniref:Uncharacterized protein n=1 Tax=Ignavibacterium album (strain DSM 19864 / JCM 16511 / NBRC 101810 / Mat9-16) TaxID=945713 RepID=I0AJ75_IGNAJ|nr:hypothetical protein [Ignavibacterium album]AFH49032.1 Hypothetical protein IALB_1322 [Ignavibacterium album JCM 16511]